jgi:hypothetical protein
MTAVVAVLAIGAAACTSTPQREPGTSATPKAGAVRLALEPGNSVKKLDEGLWYVHAVPFSFTVVVTSLAKQDQVTVHLSVPTTAMDLTGPTSGGWACADVEAGMDCTNNTAVDANQAWPALTLEARPTASAQDTIDVYVGDTHVGVPIKLDTST